MQRSGHEGARHDLDNMVIPQIQDLLDLPFLFSPVALLLIVRVALWGYGLYRVLMLSCRRLYSPFPRVCSSRSGL